MTFVDTDPVNCEAPRAERFEAHPWDATDRDTYDRPELAGVGLVVGATSNDAVNTLTCLAARGPTDQREAVPVLARARDDTGPRAMPTTLPHREVSRLLRGGQLVVTEATLVGPVLVGPDMSTPNGPMIPILVGQRI